MILVVEVFVVDYVFSVEVYDEVVFVFIGNYVDGVGVGCVD